MDSENPINEKHTEEDAQSKSHKQPNPTQNEIPFGAAPIKTDSQKPHTHCEITCKVEKDWWDKAKPFVEIAGIILLGVYTTYTIKMYSANKKAAEAASNAAQTADATLKEIQKGGVDTHELAVQAKNQADRTKDIADRALDQAKATNRLAAEAKRSADVAQQALEVQTRPWLTITDISPVRAWRSTEHIQFNFGLRNSGQSPANQAAFAFELRREPASGLGLHVFDSVCASSDARLAEPFFTRNSISVFPGDFGTITAEGEAHNTPDGDFRASHLVGCISYRGSASSSALYHTRLDYETVWGTDMSPMRQLPRDAIRSFTLKRVLAD